MDDISQSDAQSQADGTGGGEPSVQGLGEDDRSPMLSFVRDTRVPSSSAERVDTDEERDVLHISST